MSLDKRTLQALGTAGITAATLIGALGLKYHDRPLFYEHPKGVPYKKGLPILGNLLDMLKNIDRLHDFMMENFEEADSLNM